MRPAGWRQCPATLPHYEKDQDGGMSTGTVHCLAGEGAGHAGQHTFLVVESARKVMERALQDAAALRGIGWEEDADASLVERIEVQFAIPTRLPAAVQQILCELVEALARATTPEGCVHWLCATGDKPQYSRADLRFLGMPDDPDAPESGEPTFDDRVLHLETYCRAVHAAAREAGN